MKYIANVGLDFDDGKGGEQRAEAGDPVPESVIKRSPWLVDQGCVTAIEEPVAVHRGFERVTQEVTDGH